MNQFKSFKHGGFHITINGITLSVQFGAGNYCDNYNNGDFGGEANSWESSDAEIAIWGEDGIWITEKVIKKVLKENTGGNTVMGWVTPLQIGKIISWMTRRKTT